MRLERFKVSCLLDLTLLWLGLEQVKQHVTWSREMELMVRRYVVELHVLPEHIFGKVYGGTTDQVCEVMDKIFIAALRPV